MMNHIVPDFEADEDYLISELPNRSTMGGDEDIMELLWHNGQVVMQSQNQRSVESKKLETRPSTGNREIRSSVVEEETAPSDLFMQEDEMASWLHYPPVDENSLEGYLYSNDLLYPTPPSAAPFTTATSSLPQPPPPPPPPPSVIVPSCPPVPPFRRVEVESGQPKCSNFLHFSRLNKDRTPELIPSSSNSLPPALKPSAVVESNETPVVETPESRASRVSDTPAPVSIANIGCVGSMSGVGTAGTSSAGRELETCDVSVTSSAGTGGSGASASMEPWTQKPLPPTDDRKRKGRDTDDIECHSEDAEFEHPDAKKQSHGSNSTKRSRAAEVHNLSERRRRDRINEKMKALQELIPRCNKSDKASMLDEAIEYLKSLQMQVHMMSMGCSMVPMMFPAGVQQFMPPMALGMGLGLNQTMVPYPTILPGSNPAASAAAAHLGQRFPVPGFNMSPRASQGGVNLSAPMMMSFPQNQPPFADPFQHYLALHHTPLSLPQNHGGIPTIVTKPSCSKNPTNTDHHQTG